MSFWDDPSVKPDNANYMRFERVGRHDLRHHRQAAEARVQRRHLPTSGPAPEFIFTDDDAPSR